MLVNGRRLAPSGSAGTFTDVSNIPLSAIDHVDVLSDGASTLYGADAIGGIVNFVLRADPYSGESKANISVRTPSSVGEDLYQQSFGKAWDGGSGRFSAEYYDRDAVWASGRLLATMLRDAGVRHLYVMGLATDYCVKASALGGVEHGFRVTVVTRGSRAVNVQPRDGEEALSAIRAAGAEVV